MLEAGDIDVVFCDISMPGLDGMDLARVIARFAERPQVVFVTAHDQHAVDAFALDATDYVMKPVRADRLAEAVRRVVVARTEPAPGRRPAPAASPRTAAGEDETIPVELGGVTRFITRSQIRYAQARATTPGCTPTTGSHLVRIPLSVARGAVGRRTDSSASTAARWSPCRTSARCAWTTAGASSSSATSSSR